MSTAILFRPIDPSASKTREFNSVAEGLSVRFDSVAHPVVMGVDFLSVASRFAPDSVDHLIVNCHGFTDKLGCGTSGVHVATQAPPRFVSIDYFVEAWSKVVKRRLRVSLCACMCSRSPATTIRKMIGRAFGNWDPLIHEDGGLDSFSGKLRDAFASAGIEATIRGHTTAAHVLHNPALREHGPTPRTKGRSLFHLALEDFGEKITGSYRPVDFRREWDASKRFNTIVKGAIAEEWILFGDDREVVAAIRSRW